MGADNEELLKSIRYYQDSLEKYSANDNNYKVLSVIKKLKKLPIATSHLESTGIGRTVNALRKLGGEVGDAAKALVTRWKEMVVQEDVKKEKTDEESPGKETIISDDRENSYTDTKHKEKDKSSSHKSGDESERERNKVDKHSNSNRSSSVDKRKDSNKNKQDHLTTSERRMSNTDCESDSDSEEENDERKSDSNAHTSESDEGSTSSEDEDGKERERRDKNKSNSTSDRSQEKKDVEDVSSKKHKYNNNSSGERHSSKRKRHSSDSGSEQDDYERKRSKSHHRNDSDEEENRRNSDKNRTDSSKSSHNKRDDRDKEKSKKHKSEHESSSKSNSSKRKHHKSSSSGSEEENHEKIDSKSNAKHRSESDDDDEDKKHNSKRESDEKRKKHKSSSSRSDKHEPTSSKSKSKEKTDKSHDHSSKSKSSRSESNSKKELDSDDIKSSSKHKRSSHDAETEVHEKSKSKHEKESNGHKDSKSHSGKHEKKEKKDREREPSKDKHSGKDKNSKDEKDAKKEKSSTPSSSKSKESGKSSSSKQKSSTDKKGKSEIAGAAKIVHGIDSESGASFAEALGMCAPMVYSKSTGSAKKKSTPLPSPEKQNRTVSSSVPERMERPEPTVEKYVPNLLKEIPQEPLQINISSLLPEITPNYKPVAFPLDGQSKRILTPDEALSQAISNKNMRTKVYSGNKTKGGEVESLFNICVKILQDNLDAIECTGGVPYIVLKTILEKATPDQLFNLEHYNPYLIEDTDELWRLHCMKEFRTKKREEMETWREMYMRCLDEREAKLNFITANIKESQDKSLPVRTTKLAYIDSVAKPPRNIAKRQAKNGIVNRVPLKTSTSTKLTALATAGEASKVSVPNPGSRAVDRSSSSSSAAIKPKKAPLMAKTLSLFKNRFKR